MSWPACRASCRRCSTGWRRRCPAARRSAPARCTPSACRKARSPKASPAIQARYPALDIGSYPYYRATGNGVAIVAKGTDVAAAEAAIEEVTALMRALGGNPIPGEPSA